MDGKRIILYKQSWKTWLEFLINYVKGPFMDGFDFIIKTHTMTYSDYRLNPFLANVPILYLLKTPENLWFSVVFRGYQIGILARNRLIRMRPFCKLMYLEILVNAWKGVASST